MMKNFNTNVDRISILPEEIIHNILDRLTMLDIIRTSCLSKAWKSFGVSLPYLNIDHTSRDIPLGRFKDFMQHKVRSLSIQGKPLDMFKFKLCLDRLLIGSAREEIERCIKLVSETGTIKEFEFNITSGARYVVGDHNPYEIFHHIYSVECLNVLRLRGLNLAQPSGGMKLSSLQSLSLENVKLHNQSGIDWFFTGCPMIREIRLIDCDHLEHLKVSGLSHLKHLEIASCYKLTSVEIQSPGLKKLVLSEIKRDRLENFVLGLEIDSQTCETLKELTLCNSTILGSAFSRIFSGCTNVESLVLDSCVHFFKIKIASQKLRKLVVIRCFDVLVTDINAPNLTSFSFCNFWWYYYPFSVPHIEKIIYQQECMIDFNHTLQTISLWISLWFDKFKDVQGQKMVIYPESEKCMTNAVIVLEDWGSMAELPIMTKICEEAAKTTLTTMSFIDLVDYVLESNQRGGIKLENVITISSTDESKFYEALKKKRTTLSGEQCSSMAKIEVDAFLYEWCQALLQTRITGTMKAIQFSIPSRFFN